MNTATMATQHLFHNLIFRQLRLTTTVKPTSIFSFHHNNHLKTTPKFPLFHLTRPLTTLNCSLQQTLPNITSTPNDLENEMNENDESKVISEGSEEKGKRVIPLVKKEVPVLSVKEKKELGSYANSLGDKLKLQQIGKSGVTGSVAFGLDETLEKNELVKLKIHRNCPGEIEDVVRQLEEATGSVVVGQIGRTVILYRPSVTKLKAEEKKEHNRKIFEQKRKKFLAAPTVVERWKKRQ